MKISCIIPTHAREELLAQCLESILAQTRVPDEIIVVDNVPRKETELLIKEIGKQANLDIRYIVNPTGLGPSVSRNIGADEARGEVLAFVDNDDLWEAEYLEQAICRIESTDASMVITWMSNYYPEGPRPGKQMVENLVPELFVLKNPGITGSNIVIYRNDFLSLEGFDQEVLPSDDKDFMIRFLMAGQSYCVLDKTLVHHRVHDSLSLDILTMFPGKNKFYEKHQAWMPWFLRLAVKGVLTKLEQGENPFHPELISCRFALWCCRLAYGYDSRQHN